MTRQTLGALALALSAFAQDPVIRSTTQLVQISVIARDKNGPVTDLTKDDFTVFDRGKPQKIAFFNISAPQPPTPSAKLPLNTYTNQLPGISDSAPPVTVVLLDSLNTGFADAAQARQQVVRLLGMIQPGQRVALYVLGKTLRVLHDFTDSPEELGKSLSRYKTAAGDAADKVPSELDRWLGDSSELLVDWLRLYQTRVTLDALEAITSHLRSLPGRKNLVWVSGSFPLSEWAALGKNTYYNPTLVQLFSVRALRVVRAMSSGNVSIYPVDARGLIALPENMKAATRPSVTVKVPGPGAFRPDGQEIMHELAAMTGGREFFDTNDLAGAVRTAMVDSEVTYTLGFYPQEGSMDDRYHELKVAVARKGVDTRYRRGYLARSTKVPSKESLGEVISGLITTPLAAAGIELALRIDRRPDSEPKPLRFAVVINPRQFQLDHQNDRWTGEIQILIIQQDKNGNILERSDETIGLNLTQATYDRSMAQGISLTRAQDPKPGLATVRLLVVDRRSGEAGSIIAAVPNN